MEKSTISPKPEFELHRYRLLRRRQAERRHGIILVVSGVIYFILALICLLPLLVLHRMWITVGLMSFSGAIIPLYFALSGIASIHSAQRPITNREVAQQRRVARISLYRQAQGELPFSYTFKGRARTLLIRSMMTFFGASILMFFLINIPEIFWVRILLGGIVLLVELILIWDVFYLRPKEAKDIPAQSAQELSLLLITGELAGGKVLEEEPLAEE